MKIGITERGDAALDFRWTDACRAGQVDGCIAITKNCSPRFIREVMHLTRTGFPVIVHATCTGWGGSAIEPNVPSFRTQLEQACQMVAVGLPADRLVFRIDPIIPDEPGLQTTKQVLDELKQMNLYQPRIRVSVMDGYAHSLARLQLCGYDTSELRYKPTAGQFKAVADLLAAYPFVYETCAEPQLAQLNPKKFLAAGCVSNRDLKAMGLKTQQGPVNMQNRHGCLCLACKTELLTSRHPCAHRCAYCYWKD